MGEGSNPRRFQASVVELVDTLDSDSSVRKALGVRLSPEAPPSFGSAWQSAAFGTRKSQVQILQGRPRIFAPVAQLVERLPCKEKVGCSIRLTGSMFWKVGRAVDCAGLENRKLREGLASSNLALSSKFSVCLGVAVAQLAEPRVVIPMVVGSSPTGHPQAN